MELIIVESPTKAKTIQKFLGSNYKILSSFGHVRDLPKSDIGVDAENNFEPRYVIPAKAKKVVSELKKEAAKAGSVILATDEDREGESISWHLKEALKLKKPQRIAFHEITKEAIEAALKNPREIDMNLVGSQQARRILDRLVGYELSPFLWKKVARGLSAGRVQSVVVRLVCEREEEIKKFAPVEYWTIVALLLKTKNQNEKIKNAEFAAELIKKYGKPIDKLKIKNKKEADKILEELNGAEYKIEKIERKETRRNPLPPFTTSSLQQAAANKFGFSSKFTMSLAQKLYEEGRITYHRTDSLNLSSMSLAEAQKFIEKNFGKNYWAVRKFKSGKNAQEAHEAIRPTNPSTSPETIKSELTAPAFKIYSLIWQRFIACQMAPAVFDATSIEISANNYTFGTTGQILKFDGFLKVYPMKFSESELPPLEEKEILELARLNSLQHFTEPPARYNEASLIKTLEKNGIGRPSTYAPTLSTVQERNYIVKNEQKRFYPTEMGVIVNDVLTQHFPQIVDIDFTAKMEKELDDVAEGKEPWQKACGDFYGPFSKNLKEKYESVAKKKTDIETDMACPDCAKPLVERLGRFGRFYACSGFPECKYSASIENEAEKLDIVCPSCKIGNMKIKRTKRGKIFYGCDQYPKCNFALWDKPVNEFCPKCNSILVEIKRKQIRCSNKECDYKKS